MNIILLTLAMLLNSCSGEALLKNDDQSKTDDSGTDSTGGTDTGTDSTDDSVAPGTDIGTVVFKDAAGNDVDFKAVVAKCLNDNADATAYQACVDASFSEGARSAPIYACRHLLESEATAKAATTKFTTSVALPVPATDTCAVTFPAAFVLKPQAEHYAERAAAAKLPMDYAAYLDSVDYFLANYRATYIDTPATKFILPTEDEYSCTGKTVATFATSTTVKIERWTSPKDWFNVSVTGMAFFHAYKVLKDDPANKERADKAKAAFLDMANYAATQSNATDFEGVTLSNPFDGNKKVKPLGWNNLASGWDAHRNGTCSIPQQPNLYSSGWSLYLIATAYTESQDPKLLEAFYRGAMYWHMSLASPVFKAGYSNFVASKAKLDTQLPYALKALYTVGGTAALTGQPADKRPIRYHYTVSDPGRYVPNTHAMLAAAMAIAGKAAPTHSFLLANGDGGNTLRTWTNIANSANYVSYRNIVGPNYDYYDSGDILKIGPSIGYYGTTAFGTAVAGAALGNATYVDRTRDELVKLFLDPPTEKHRLLALLPICTFRALSDDLFTYCDQKVTTIPHDMKFNMTLMIAGFSFDHFK